MNNQKMGYFPKDELGLEPHEGEGSKGVEMAGTSGFITFATMAKDSSVNKQFVEALYQSKTDKVVSPTNPLYTEIRNQLMGTPEQTGPVLPLAQQKEVKEQKPRPSISAEEQRAYLQSLSDGVKLRQEVPIDSSKTVILTQDTVRMNRDEMKTLAVKTGLVDRVLGISDVVFEAYKALFEKVNAKTGDDLVNSRKSKIADRFQAIQTRDDVQCELGSGVTGQGVRHNG